MPKLVQNVRGNPVEIYLFPGFNTFTFLLLYLLKNKVVYSKGGITMKSSLTYLYAAVIILFFILTDIGHQLSTIAN